MSHEGLAISLFVVFVAATLAAGLGEGAIRNASPPAGGVATSKAVAKVATPQPDERSGPVPVAGRVIGPDGRPVAGAKLYVTPIYESGRSPSPTVRSCCLTSLTSSLFWNASDLAICPPA